MDSFETSKTNKDELKLEQTKTTKYAERHSFVSKKSFCKQIDTMLLPVSTKLSERKRKKEKKKAVMGECWNSAIF